MDEQQATLIVIPAGRLVVAEQALAPVEELGEGPGWQPRQGGELEQGAAAVAVAVAVAAAAAAVALPASVVPG